jgi:DNA processing protein
MVNRTLALNYATIKAATQNKSIDYTLVEDEKIIDHLLKYSSLLEISIERLTEIYTKIERDFSLLKESDLILRKGDSNYPKKLDEFEEAPYFLFIRGNISLLDETLVSVLGTKNPSSLAIRECKEAIESLIKNQFTIATSLEAGLATVAQVSALQQKIATVAFLDFPLTQYPYPKYQQLQDLIGKEGILVSQFAPNENFQRWHPLKRSSLMNQFANFTLLLEAQDGQGCVKQAEQFTHLNKELFLLRTSVENRSILWPRRLAKHAKTIVADKPNQIGTLIKKKREIISSHQQHQLSLFDLS